MALLLFKLHNLTFEPLWQGHIETAVNPAVRTQENGGNSFPPSMGMSSKRYLLENFNKISRLKINVLLKYHTATGWL